MSVKKGGREWEEEPSERLTELDVADLDLAWGVLKEGLAEAKGVLDGKVTPEDSSFASEEGAKRIMEAAQQVKGALFEMEMFPLWNMLEIVRERKKKGSTSD